MKKYSTSPIGALDLENANLMDGKQRYYSIKVVGIHSYNSDESRKVVIVKLEDNRLGYLIVGATLNSFVNKCCYVIYTNVLRHTKTTETTYDISNSIDAIDLGDEYITEFGFGYTHIKIIGVGLSESG